MAEENSEVFVCTNCGTEAPESHEFCRNCGSVFQEGAYCANHPENDADGVCIICQIALCVSCGAWVHNRFLCTRHRDYEIWEGWARVFTGSEPAQIEYAKLRLEQAGLRPVLHESQPVYFAASSEFKVMVPCGEVNEAERVLVDLKIKTG